MNDKHEKICKSVFKTGDEPTKEAFTTALAKAISRIENEKPYEIADPEDQCEKKMDT